MVIYLTAGCLFGKFDRNVRDLPLPGCHKALSRHYFLPMHIRGKEIVLFDNKSKHLDRFGWVLFLTASSVILLSLVNAYQPEQALGSRLFSTSATMAVGLTLLMTARATGVARRFLRFIDVAVLMVMTTTAAMVFTDGFYRNDPLRTFNAPFMIIVIAVFAPIMIVRRLVEHRRVTRSTMFGALAGYLLIPIVYFYTFIVIADWRGESFFALQYPSPSYMYYSLTSLTTLGYGDLTAQSNIGHLLSTSEALIGQVYLVAFVAMLVGLFTNQWLESRSNRQSEESS